MKDNIKIVLLSIIAGTLLYQNFFNAEQSESVASPQNIDTHNHTEQSKSIPEQTSNQPKTTLSFKELEYNFGKIKQDSENKHLFVFTNTGNEPLIISSAQGSCGCTVPKYPKDPIPPGKSGEIEVVYSPGKQQGKQTKTVTITANTEPNTTQLKISAEVEVVE